MRQMITKCGLCVAAAVAVCASAAAPGDESGSLTLEGAVQLALTNNPSLHASLRGVDAADWRADQAGAWSNPELDLAIEEYDRDGAGIDSAEIAVGIGQKIELGGKRRSRRQLAGAEAQLARIESKHVERKVVATTARRFVRVLSAQAALELAAEATKVAEKTAELSGESVKAGKAAPVHLSKANAELELVRLDESEAQTRLDLARKSLIAMWAQDGEGARDVRGSIEGLPESVDGIDALLPRLALNPELACCAVELKVAEAALGSERAARVPDLKTELAYHHYEEDGTDAIAVGVGFPLPIFNRNKAGILAARQELSKVEAERIAVRLALTKELEELHAAMVSAHRRAAVLQSSVIPALEEALAATREGYRQGKFGFLDMLDAQRGLSEVRKALVNAFTEFQLARIGVWSVTAGSIEELIGTGLGEKR